MDENLEVKWRKKDLEFICRSCAFYPSGGYNFEAALNRFHSSSSAQSELLLLTTYNVVLPESSPDYSGTVDKVSVEILKKFHPVILESYHPIGVTGDGNCFYRAISLALFATEDFHLHIRLLVAIEIRIFPEYYDYVHAEFKGPQLDTTILYDDYESEVKSTSTPGQYAGILQFYAASAALKIHLRSYCPPVMNDHFLTTPLSKKINGRGLKETGVEKAIIMWTCTYVPRSGLKFRPNHFVIMRKKASKIIEEPMAINTSSDEELGSVQTSSKNVSIMGEESSRKDPRKTSYTIKETNTDLSDGESLELPDIDENYNKRKRDSFDTSFSISNHSDENRRNLEHKMEDKRECSGSDDSVGEDAFRSKEKITSEESPELDTSYSDKDDCLDHKLEEIDVEESITYDDSIDELVNSKENVSNELAKDYNVNNEEKSPELEVHHEYLFQSAPSDQEETTAEPVADDSQDLPSGKFMASNELIKILLSDYIEYLKRIPDGRKEDCYFIVDNSTNKERRLANLNSCFNDDCGAWKKSPSPITRFVRSGSGWHQVVKVDGKICHEGKSSGHRIYTPLEPQPAVDNILEVHRNYNRSKMDPNYKRRISWVEPSDRPVMIVEYLGKFPGRQHHGNATKKSRPYSRTAPSVLANIAEMSQKNPPREVYERMNEQHKKEEDRPKDLKQVQNKVYNEKKKDNDGNSRSGGNNLADNLIYLHSILLNHKFLRHIYQDQNQVPIIILYTDDQMRDITRFCCSYPAGKATVLGIDKTYNLGQLLVTPTVFKHLGVVRSGTSSHPLFFGPILLHGNSDWQTYGTFLNVIAMMLHDSMSPPVIGSDQEKAIRKAAKFAFFNSEMTSCLRHLKDNMTCYLRDKVGCSMRTRGIVLQSVFGQNGITKANTLAVFEERVSITKTIVQQHSPEFADYFNNQLFPLLHENMMTLLNRPEVDPGEWTNNNSESLNHVLKMKIDWHPQTIPKLIDSIHSVVKGHYTDVERAFIGRGEYQLVEPLKKKFEVYPSVWEKKTKEQRSFHWKKLQKAVQVTLV